MTEQLFREWLSDSKKINKHELNSFAATTGENLDLMQVIFNVLNDKGKHHEFLDPLCHQFFRFYRLKNVLLQRFILQFLPTFIWLYLNSVAHSDKKTFKQVEVLLLGIYNLVIVDDDGNPIVISYNLPSLTQPSIYHEPISLQALTLTENALSKLEFGANRSLLVGPFVNYDRINAQNRLKIMTVLVTTYNRNVSFMSKSSLQALCKMVNKLCKHGFHKSSVQRYGTAADSGSFNAPSHSRIHPRIPVSPPLLLELLHSTYFTMFNGLANAGFQAVEDIKVRGSYEMYPDVMMVCNAICNSVKNNPSLQLSDGHIAVAMSPSPSAQSISKAVITNASFKTKKLPDDISIPNGKDESLNETPKLMAISEDSEDSSQSGSRAASKSKEKPIKIPYKKDKPKPKHKDQNSETSGSNVSLKSKDEIVSNKAAKNDNLFTHAPKYSRTSSDYILSSKVDTQISVTNSGVEVGVVHRKSGEKNRRSDGSSNRPHSIHSLV